MKTTLTLNFNASCDRVADMLIDPEFTQFVGDTLNAENVTVTPIPEGLTAVITVATPENAGKIFGRQMTLTETITWEEPSEEGSREGRMTMTMSGVPASLTGPTTLNPTPEGSAMLYEADFSVRIPLIGKKIEKLVEEYLEKLIEAFEAFGNQWLLTQEAEEDIS